MGESLKLSCFFNGEPWTIDVSTFNMTPFGIAFFCEPQPGVVWLWKKEWCEAVVPTAKGVNKYSHVSSLIADNVFALLNG